MPTDRAWTTALAEHEAAVADFIAQLHRVPAARWTSPASDGKWSPAEEALHVVLAYELGLATLAGSPGMELRVSPARASLFRWVLLPLLLRTGTFPRGAEAPPEVRPARTEAVALSAEAIRTRLRRAATETAQALRAADGRRPPVRVVHAYFGPLPPLTALRLLSGHTRHHARALARRRSAGPSGIPSSQ